MSRKALPRAITRPLDDIKAITGTTADAPQKKQKTRRAKTHKSSEDVAASSKTVQREQHAAAPAADDATPVASTPAPAANAPEDVVSSANAAAAPVPVATAPADTKAAIDSPPEPQTSVDPDPQAAQRREQALKIVERYKYYAAAGGLLPIPVVNVAGVTAINMRMAMALSQFYGVPFERDRARSVILSFIGGAAPSGLGVATASTLAMVGPAGGLVGLAVCSVSAAALTKGLGAIFIERFEAAVQNQA